VLAVASHPIQYQGPWFRALAVAHEIDFSVLFVQLLDSRAQGRGFGVAFEWDVPILDGYRWQQVPEIRGRGHRQGFFSIGIRHPIALLRRLQPDVLLITGWHIWPLLQMLIAAAWAGIPVIMRGEANAMRRRGAFARFVHRLILSRCTAFLPIGKSSRDFYRSYGIADSRLFATPYFVDNARFSRSATDAAPQRADLRRRWSIPNQSVCFCYAGKLEPKKRILDLLEAIRLAVLAHSNVHLLVVGTGNLLELAKAVAAEHKLPVTFAGFLNQSEIPAAYVASDCLVLPSDYGETWGLVVNEAMACGRPAVVSNRVGCAADLVTDGQTGAIFPFGDTTALARCLIDLAADPEHVAKMGQKARARVLDGYSLEGAVAGTLSAVRYVLDKM
jgi:glycosyltransferase involved in cell wall biosynthesis